MCTWVYAQMDPSPTWLYLPPVPRPLQLNPMLDWRMTGGRMPTDGCCASLTEAVILPRHDARHLQRAREQRHELGGRHAPDLCKRDGALLRHVAGTVIMRRPAHLRALRAPGCQHPRPVAVCHQRLPCRPAEHLRRIGIGSPQDG